MSTVVFIHIYSVHANILYVWIIIVITFLMIIGLWVFPEAKGKITQEK